MPDSPRQQPQAIALPLDPPASTGAKIDHAALELDRRRRKAQRTVAGVIAEAIWNGARAKMLRR